MSLLGKAVYVVVLTCAITMHYVAGMQSGLGQDRVFSGPQVGESLPAFTVAGQFDQRGKTLDFVKQAGQGPILLIFVHDSNRPTLRMTQAITYHTWSIKKLTTGVVWLNDDVSAAEVLIEQKRPALNPESDLGIYLGGKEGPGSYGLNRNVAITILIGEKGKVTANFALVQPSLAADLPNIMRELSKVTGEVEPTLDDLLVLGMVKLQGPMTQIVQRNATPEKVQREASHIEALAMADDVRAELGRTARRLVENGRLESYGTSRAREYIRKWAKDYGGDAKK